MSFDEPEFEPLPPPPKPAPVSDAARIHALDVARGFALLGIFFVNIQSFSQPLGLFADQKPPEGSGIAGQIVFYLVKILCESKFYPLFSLLFGIGVALQFTRAYEANRRFAGLALRRLGILFLIGLCHALLLWYGDVLVPYSIAGLALLLMVRCRARTLAITASIIVIVGILAISVLAFFTAPDAPPPRPTAEIQHYADPFGTFWKAFSTGKLEGPTDAIWIQTEQQAYSEGPYSQMFMFRLVTWAMFIVIELLGVILFIVAIFLFGAAMLKAGLFEPQNRRWRVLLFRLGLFIGLPLSAVSPFVDHFIPGPIGHAIEALLVSVGGPLLSLGYLMAWTLAVENGYLRRVTDALANAGRMALTNYLTQTVIATTIFYYYGLGLFGQTTQLQNVGIVFAIYLLQLAISAIWLRYFRFGPMEWLWRSLTYVKAQPFVRRHSSVPVVRLVP